MLRPTALMASCDSLAGDAPALDRARSLVQAAVHGAVMGACQANASCKTASSVAAAAVRAALASAPLSNHIDDGVAMRCKLSSASIIAHNELHKVAGSSCHYMGCALAAARPELPHDVAKALRKFQSLANEARHEWPAGSPEVVSPLGSPQQMPAKVDGQPAVAVTDAAETPQPSDAEAPSEESLSADALLCGVATTLAHIEQQMELDPAAWKPAYISAKDCLERATLHLRRWRRGTG